MLSEKSQVSGKLIVFVYIHTNCIGVYTHGYVLPFRKDIWGIGTETTLCSAAVKQIEPYKLRQGTLNNMIERITP